MLQIIGYRCLTSLSQLMMSMIYVPKLPEDNAMIWYMETFLELIFPGHRKKGALSRRHFHCPLLCDLSSVKDIKK